MHLCFEKFIKNVYSDRLEMHGIVVRQHNEILNQFQWRDGRRADIRSCSKSVLSLAVGMAIEEGLLSLDEKVVDIFPDKVPDNPSDNMLEMKVRHLLTQSAGYDSYVLHGLTRDWLEDTDWVHYSLHQPIKFKPGTKFVYNNCAPYLASVAVQKRAGQTLLEYLKPRLFDPLKIPNPQWQTCPMGYTLGVGSLILNLEEMSRIGQLCLNKGVWEGKQLVPAKWIEEASACQIETTNATRKTKDFTAGYGYLFWRCADYDAYRAYGMYGQHIIVLPQHDAVVTTAAHVEGDVQKILDAVWETIIPQLQ